VRKTLIGKIAAARALQAEIGSSITTVDGSRLTGALLLCYTVPKPTEICKHEP
jgi:hypothetical protein